MNGGIFDAMRNLTIATAAENRYLPIVFGVNDRYTERDLPLWENIATNTFMVRGPRIFGYAPGLANAVEASNPDILHIHGIWMYPSLVSLRSARSDQTLSLSVRTACSSLWLCEIPAGRNGLRPCFLRMTICAARLACTH